MANRSSPDRGKISPGVLTFLLVVLLIACFYWAKPVLIPAAIAMLLAFVLNPIVTALCRLAVPRTLSVFTVVGACGICIGLCGWVLTTQTMEFLNQLPDYQDNITRRIEELRGQSRHSVIAKVETFVDKVAAAATRPIKSAENGTRQPVIAPRPHAATAPTEPLNVVTVPNSTYFTPYLDSVGQLVEFLANTGLIAVLVIYFLLYRNDLRNRLVRLLGEGNVTHTTKALDDAGQGLSRYLFAQLMLNSSFGVFIGTGLWLLGLPYALLWGFVATFLRYIPFFGPWIAAALPLALSLSVGSGWFQPLGILVLFVSFEVFANLAAEPLLYGKSMGVYPAALLVAMAFWSWLWGTMGLVLAVPLTVCLVVLGRHVPQLKFLDVLLGDEPALTADLQFYQRILARDQDEASRIAQKQLAELSLAEVYDRILIPALVLARRDLDAELITDSDVALILEMTAEIAEELRWSASDGAQATVISDVDETELGSRLSILACAARDAADETALGLFQSLLDPRVCHAEVITTDRMISEIVAMVAEERLSIVCIAALPPGGLAHTRLLCKRLRARFPKLKIVVGRWGLTTDVDGNRQQLDAAGADYFATTLQETSIQLVQLAQFMKPGESIKRSVEQTQVPEHTAI